MLALEIVSGIIFICSFFYGAFKLWKKGIALYYQIIIAAVGCYAIYQVFSIVMVFCNINETYFNDGFFGLLSSYLFLFCANIGAFDKIFEKPKTKYLIICILCGLIMFSLSIVVGLLFFDSFSVLFFIFVLQQLPASFVVFYCVKHLFTPADELGLIKNIRLVDIFSILFCVISLLDLFAWVNPGVLSGVADVVLSFLAIGLTISAVKGAQKWKR